MFLSNVLPQRAVHSLFFRAKFQLSPVSISFLHVNLMLKENMGCGRRGYVDLIELSLINPSS